MTDIDLYSKESLAAIAESNFLSVDDMQSLSKMREELQDTWEKRQIWRTETEMRFSVLNDAKFPTKASKYWQSVREQAVFFENLVALSFQYRRQLIKITRLKKNLELATDPLDKQEIEIDIEEALYGKRTMELSAKDRMRELNLWSKIKSELDDGSFDVNDVNSHQLESYTKRMLSECKSVKSTGAHLSHAEARNLLGQTASLVRLCEEKGMLNKIAGSTDEETMKLLGYTSIRKD